MSSSASEDPSSEPAAEELLDLLVSGEQAAGIGSWKWFADAGSLVWSDNLFRLFGFEPGEITPTPGFVMKMMARDERERLTRYAEKLQRGSTLLPIEYRINIPGKGVRYFRSTIASSSANLIVGIVQDLSHEREVTAHIAVSGALARWRGLEESAEGLLGDLAEALGSVFAVLWLPEQELLSASAVWSDPALPDDTGLEAATLALRVKQGVKLPGRVWQSRAPLNIIDLLAEPNGGRQQAAARAGLRGALAFPALHGGDVIAVLEFLYRDAFQLTGRLSRTLGSIGHQLGEFLWRHRNELHPPRLTARELQILQSAADGRSGPEIATQLGITTATVRTHMQHILRKLDVDDRAAAVAVGIRSGLIE